MKNRIGTIIANTIIIMTFIMTVSFIVVFFSIFFYNLFNQEHLTYPFLYKDFPEVVLENLNIEKSRIELISNVLSIITIPIIIIVIIVPLFVTFLVSMQLYNNSNRSSFVQSFFPFTSYFTALIFTDLCYQILF